MVTHQTQTWVPGCTGAISLLGSLWCCCIRNVAGEAELPGKGQGKVTAQPRRVLLLFVLPQVSGCCPHATKCPPVSSQGVEVTLMALQSPVPLSLLLSPLQFLCQVMSP